MLKARAPATSTRRDYLTTSRPSGYGDKAQRQESIVDEDLSTSYYYYLSPAKPAGSQYTGSCSALEIVCMPIFLLGYTSDTKPDQLFNWHPLYTKEIRDCDQA